MEDIPDIDLGWGRPKGKFIHIPQECVENNDGRSMDSTRRDIGRPQGKYPVNPVVHMAYPVSGVMCIVSYAGLVK